MPKIIRNNLASINTAITEVDLPADFDFIKLPAYNNLACIFSPRYSIDSLAERAGFNRMVNLVNGRPCQARGNFTVVDELLLPSESDSPRVSSAVNINPSSFTLFFVTKPATTSNTKHIFYSTTEQIGVVGLRIAITTNGNNLLMYENTSRTGGQPVRIRHDSNFASRSEPSILFVTFSEQAGLKIYDNGALVAENASDTRPLNFGYLGNEYLFGGAGSQLGNLYGEFGIFNEDISMVDGLVDDLYQRLLSLKTPL